MAIKYKAMYKFLVIIISLLLINITISIITDGDQGRIKLTLESHRKHDN